MRKTMNQGVYKIAGHVVKINSQYQRIHKQCREYADDGSPELYITISNEDIQREIKKAGDTGKKYQEDYLETLAVYRKLAEELLKFNVLLFHGSLVAVDGIGYLFTAKSGTGKSAHTGLWKKQFGKRAVIVNDDKPLLEVTEAGVLAYGTPWDGKHHLSENIMVPLKAICILRRGEENTIQPVEKEKNYPMLLQQAYRPENKEALRKMLQVLELLLSKVELYELFCNMEPGAARVSYEGMNQ